MLKPQVVRLSLPRHLRPHQPVLRAFSTSPQLLQPSFLDLQARAVSRENNHFSKLSKGNYIEHSPALQLLRSERDLAEGKNVKAEQDGILLNKKPKTDRETILTQEYQAQVASLQAQLIAKERAWRDRFQSERKEWEDQEEKSLRLRLMFFVSLVLMGLLAADSIMLADDVEEHCPGCFSGNTKNQLFVVGYLKSATEAAARWFAGENAVKKPAVAKKHEHEPAAVASAKNVKDLPKGWEEIKNPDGKAYFVNHNDRTTTWLDPRGVSKPGEKGLPAGWEELKTRDGRPYFTNHVERYTTWEDPRIEKKARKAQTANQVNNGPSMWQKLMWAR